MIRAQSSSLKIIDTIMEKSLSKYGSFLYIEAFDSQTSININNVTFDTSYC